MNLNNIDIRKRVSESGLKYKDIAKQMGVSRVWLSTLMSRPLSSENKSKIMCAIKALIENDILDATTFNVVECVESGNGFLKGHFYAQVGDNNGIQIQRCDAFGDCVTFSFCNGGTGRGSINSWDGNGKPSFIERKVEII